MNKVRSILIIVLLISTLLVSASCAKEPGSNKEIAASNISDQAQIVVAEQIEESYDDYSTYYTQTEYQILFADFQGSFGGVGISMVEIDERIIVFSVINDTPAEGTDIAAGDIILSVDGTSLSGLDTTDAAGLIRGEIGTDVVLEFEKAIDDSIYTVSITRDTITSETVTGANLTEYPGTAYINISLFNELTSIKFQEMYEKLNSERNIENLILDLRSNGGGDFHSCITISENFIPVNDVVVSEKTSSGTDVHTSTNGQLQDIKLVILQNAYTASASEVLIGSVWDFDHVILIGTTTFGKGITQSVRSLPSGSGHRFTRSIYYTPSGFSLHEVGLAPDIIVEDGEQSTASEYFSLDPKLNDHLAAALEYLFPQNDSIE